MAEQGGRRCEHLKANGERCETFAVDASPYCYFHSPDLAEARAESRRQGGLNRRVPRPTEGPAPRIEGPGDILDLLNLALADAWSLEKSERRVRSLIAVAQSAVDRVTERRSSAWSAFVIACAAAHLDEDQVGTFRHELRDLAPAEILAGLKAVDRHLPDIELAARLLLAFDFAFDAAVRPHSMDFGQFESREGLESYLVRKVRPLQERLRDLRGQGRQGEVEVWMKFIARLAQFLMQAIEIARPELLRTAISGGEDGHRRP